MERNLYAIGEVMNKNKGISGGKKAPLDRDFVFKIILKFNTNNISFAYLNIFFLYEK
ncbi:hypothetical protein GCM10027450_02490 [Pseudidiomarina andamanensis]